MCGTTYCTCGITDEMRMTLLLFGFVHSQTHGAYVLRSNRLYYHRDADKVYVETVLHTGEITIKGFVTTDTLGVTNHLIKLEKESNHGTKSP